MSLEEELNHDKKLHAYLTDFSDYYRIIEKNKKIEDLKALYKKIKMISSEFYHDGEIHYLYKDVISELRHSEILFKNEFLIDCSFTFDNQKVPIISNDSNELDILKYLVHECRKYLLTSRLRFSSEKMDQITEWNVNFVNFCYVANTKIKRLCDSLGIKCHKLDIQPGYDKDSNLLNGNGYHIANIIELGRKYFLVDVTYMQFFSLSVANLERIGLMNYPLTKAGCFMTMTDSRLSVALKILKDGYIELNERVLKDYLDGFTISFRNGLYYEDTNDYSYTTQYSSTDYVNFLTGQDNQINHEGKEVLGFQKKPINYL